MSTLVEIKTKCGISQKHKRLKLGRKERKSFFTFIFWTFHYVIIYNRCVYQYVVIDLAHICFFTVTLTLTLIIKTILCVSIRASWYCCCRRCRVKSSNFKCWNFTGETKKNVLFLFVEYLSTFYEYCQKCCK